jgi:hypothetical protein
MPVIAAGVVVVVDDLEPRGDKFPGNAPIGIVNIVDNGGGWEEGRLEAGLPVIRPLLILGLK